MNYLLIPTWYFVLWSVTWLLGGALGVILYKVLT